VEGDVFVLLILSFDGGRDFHTGVEWEIDG